MVDGAVSCLSSSGSWVLQPSQGTPCCWVAPIMCTGVPAGAIFSMPAGRLIFAASLSTNSSAPGETVAGGAGAVVLHAAGEVAAVEDRAHVKVAVGDFFTAAVLAVLTTARVGMLVGAWAA